MDKKRGLLNIGTSIVSRIILLLVALYIRRLLIFYIGNEVNGLNSLYGSIIGLLSVAELGVGVAIIYSMYSPIVSGDNSKVAALYCLYRKLYRIIGAVIFVAGLAMMPFLPGMISDYGSLDVNVYLTFFLTLLSVVISYLYSAKSALIEAYKDSYISTTIVTISRMIRSALQIAAIIIWKSFEIFLVCQIIETIIIWIVTEKVVKKLHPDILVLSKTEKPVLDSESKKDITRNIKAMFMHKIGAIFVGAVDSMIISIFIGVVILGKYSNYTAILGAMTGIIVLFFTPLTSVIGHMCAAKEPGEIRKYFHFFYSMNFVLGVTFFMGYYAVIDNVVGILFGGNLIMSRTVPFVITVNGFIGYMRYALIIFRDASGIFYYDRWKPIGESIANIILSILFVNIFPAEYSVVGVIVATIITCLLICNIVEPHILFKYVFKEPATKFYLLNYSRTVVFTLCLLLVNRFSISCDNSFIELVVNGMISVGISGALLGLLVAVDRGFRQDVRTLISQIREWCINLLGRIKKNIRKKRARKKEYSVWLRRIKGDVSPELEAKRKDFFAAHDDIDFFHVPIFIISYNRLTYLKDLIDKLQQMGYDNINIIDNDSTYQPLLDYYETTDCKLFRMPENYGHMVFWESDIFKEYRDDLYVVTDPDIMPVDDCPNDFVEEFYKLLKEYPGARKVGLSLKIDDIPKDAPLHDEVIEWEEKYNTHKLMSKNAYIADIDTTLALYIPDHLNITSRFITAIRTGEPYQARHLPWYKRTEDINKEQEYYSEHRQNGFWDEVSGNRTGEGM